MATPASLICLSMWQWAKMTEVSAARGAARAEEATGAAVKVAWARAAAAMVVVERAVAAIGVEMTVGAARGRTA